MNIPICRYVVYVEEKDAYVLNISNKLARYHAAFYVEDYESDEAALTAALKERKEVCEEVGIELHECDPYSEPYLSNKSTRIRGVHRTERSDRNGYAYYVASWMNEDNRQVARSFSVKYYGEEEAFSRAVMTRLKATGRL